MRIVHKAAHVVHEHSLLRLLIILVRCKGCEHAVRKFLVPEVLILLGFLRVSTVLRQVALRRAHIRAL